MMVKEAGMDPDGHVMVWEVVSVSIDPDTVAEPLAWRPLPDWSYHDPPTYVYKGSRYTPQGAAVVTNRTKHVCIASDDTRAHAYLLRR